MFKVVVKLAAFHMALAAALLLSGCRLVTSLCSVNPLEGLVFEPHAYCVLACTILLTYPLLRLRLYLLAAGVAVSAVTGASAAVDGSAAFAHSVGQLALFFLCLVLQLQGCQVGCHRLLTPAVTSLFLGALWVFRSGSNFSFWSWDPIEVASLVLPSALLYKAHRWGYSSFIAGSGLALVAARWFRLSPSSSNHHVSSSLFDTPQEYFTRLDLLSFNQSALVSAAVVGLTSALLITTLGIGGRLLALRAAPLPTAALLWLIAILVDWKVLAVSWPVFYKSRLYKVSLGLACAHIAAASMALLLFLDGSALLLNPSLSSPLASLLFILLLNRPLSRSR